MQSPIRHDTAESESWAAEFFDENFIVNTFQCLLQNTAQSVEDLCRLCVAAREDRVVLAFNVHGLMPFATHPEYVFEFSKMNVRQLRSLRKHYRDLPDTMTCEYDVDMYVLKASPENYQIEHELLLFAAGCILLKGLSQTKVVARGFCMSRLAENRDALLYHTNAILLHIINACALKNGAVRAAMRLLEHHGVTVP